ncbi:MAG: lycopene cyclase family protein, partial [Arachnia sp.]
DPHPERSWPQTLGGWRRQLPAWLPEDVVASTARDPEIRAVAHHPIRDEYAILDNGAVQRATPLAGVTLEEQLLGDDGVVALRERARIVVDARGARPAGHPGTMPHQTAHGVLVPPAVAAPVLGSAEAVLMDWRPFDGSSRWGGTDPTFLYVIPMPDGRVLLEETCLAGDPGIGQEELRRRLLRRLENYGIGPGDVAGAEIERVSIPLVRRGDHVERVLRFGAAGAQNNPFSGYTFFASLAAVDPVVASVLRGVTTRRDEPLLARRRALHGLLRLSPDDTFALFDAFGRLNPAQQRAVLDANTPLPKLVAAMTRQFSLMSARSGIGLARATLLS